MAGGTAAGTPSRSDRVLAIIGPTASGKSAVALGVAGRAGGEIVSADSMQVYRGLDIGTAKPSPEERHRIPHHLIDVADPAESFSVATYQSLARQALRAINCRGRLPVVVGGTGLYVRALLYDYDFSPPGRDPALRSELEEQAGSAGPPALHCRLRQVDPQAAARIHPNDARLIIRAIEVWETTGKPLSSTWGFLEPLYDALIIGLRLSRDEMYRRIDERVDAMVAMGLVDEVRRLVALGYTTALVSGQALGYKEMVGYLDGSTSLEVAVAAIKRSTRNYAKRQMTWFRREQGVVWLDGPGSEGGPLVDYILGLAAAKWGQSY